MRPLDYEPQRSHRVCSLHFIDGKPTKENPFPKELVLYISSFGTCYSMAELLFNHSIESAGQFPLTNNSVAPLGERAVMSVVD
jgi:hypothetical protein